LNQKIFFSIQRINKKNNIHTKIPMVQLKMKMSLVLVTLVLLCAVGALAQSNCMNEIVSLSPCLNYVTGNTSTPTSGCCIQLASVVKSQPQCLCLIIDDKKPFLGIKVNQTLALALPSVCNVETPPPSLCKSKSSMFLLILPL
jgi:hypothetical protein